ncbi:hypothetical protein [Helicobacter sp. 23-1046]
MKKLATFLFVAMLGASVLSAIEVRAQQSVSGLQSQELEALFGANANDVNVVLLSEEELKDTQGELAPAVVYIGSAIAGGALGALGGDIYRGIKRIFGW